MSPRDLLLLTVLVTLCVLTSCRKDPVVVPSHTEAELCTSISEQDLEAGDTVTAVIGESESISVDIDGNEISDFVLWCTGQDVNPGPGFAWGAEHYIYAYYLDSLGIIWPGGNCSYASFSPGDTLSPNAILLTSATLFSWGQGSPCDDHYSTWNIGFVRIINGAKHAGVIRIGSTNINYVRRYWFERVPTADCPGESFMLSE